MISRKKPDWLKIKLPQANNFSLVSETIKNYGLNTICISGKCPNMGECWDRGTATFMILGNICTRACKFCAVATGRPLPPDSDEPVKVARTVKALNLKHCVLTSVDRDDLNDFGSQHWANVVTEIKKLNPSATIETLIPDFDGKREYIQKVIDAKPNVISHNLETVKRLTPAIRTKAQYDKSLEVLKIIAESGIVAKSGIMLGLGETREEILQTMDDLLNAGCKVFTLGQYLQPTNENIEVKEYIHPDVFEEYRITGLEKGFKFVESSPLVRSSYHAEKHVKNSE